MSKFKILKGPDEEVVKRIKKEVLGELYTDTLTIKSKGEEDFRKAREVCSLCHFLASCFAYARGVEINNFCRETLESHEYFYEEDEELKKKYEEQNKNYINARIFTRKD